MAADFTQAAFVEERCEVLTGQVAYLVSELAHTRLLLKQALAELEKTEEVEPDGDGG